MTPAFRHALVWALASSLMIVAALSSITSAYFHGHYVPDNADAFYHARRILDAVINHASVIQFDPKMHVPEGSWISWPWGYDQLMATITGWFGPFENSDAAFRVLANIPPLACAIATLLVVVIARQLGLGLVYTAVLAFSFALLPAAFRAFSVGNVDHHFAEYIWTLAMISAGLRFFREGEDSLLPGIVLGGLLGFGLAIQTSLVILQAPICAALALRWLRGESLPARRRMVAFALALLFASLGACWPAETWRHGLFEFYTLSWFHLYVSAVVAVFTILLATLSRSTRNTTAILVLALVAVAPVAKMLLEAATFVSGNLDLIADVSEAQSPYRLFFDKSDDQSTRSMSYLLLLMAPMTLLNVWWAWKMRDATLQFIAIVCAWGLVMFQLQFRFCTYGVLPMLLTPLLAAQVYAADHPHWRRWLPGGLLVVYALAFVPTAQNWKTTIALGDNLAYPNLGTIWPRLGELCATRPGVVLSNVDAGHWVRYHTGCSVIANVFLLTPQHAAKIQENAHLLAMTPAQLLAARRDIDYVLAFQTVTIRNDASGNEVPNLESLRADLDPLERDLLGPEDAIPKEFGKKWEVRSPQGQVYARLYAIERR